MIRHKLLVHLVLVSGIFLAILPLSRSVAQSCPASTLADPAGVPQGDYPQQYELSEYQNLANCTLGFSSNPYFLESSEWYSYGNLPLVEERLPAEPLVVQPYEQIGHYGGILYGSSNEPESGGADFLSLRHVNLVMLGTDNTIVPNIAKGWSYNEGYTELTIFLRKGHRWSDGAPFTAEDVSFWYNDFILNPELYGSVPNLWVFGGEPMQVEAVDETTVKFSFAAPAPNFLRLLTFIYVQPFQPKHVLSRFHITYNPEANELATSLGYESWTQLMGQYYKDWKDETHPLSEPNPLVLPTLESHFLIHETENERIFIANPYFHVADTIGQQLPYINAFHEKFFKGNRELLLDWATHGELSYKTQGLGLLDFPFLESGQAQGDYTLQYITGGADTNVVAFNITHPDPALAAIFSDLRFRQAMSLAIDRGEINQIIYYGLGTPMQALPIDFNTVDFISEDQISAFAQYDPNLANALLDEMGLAARDEEGFRLRFDGEPLVLHFRLANSDSPDLPILLKDYWEAVGIRIELTFDLALTDYRVLARENTLEITWTGNDNTSIDTAVGDPGRLLPPFTLLRLSPRTGVPWDDWMLSGGTQGIEPPEDVKRLYGLVSEFVNYPAGSEESNRIGAEIVQIHIDNLFYIGLVGNLPRSSILSNLLANVPEFGAVTADLITYRFRPYQWFFSE